MRTANPTSRKVMLALVSIMLVLTFFAATFTSSVKGTFNTDSVQTGSSDNYRVIAYVTQWNWPGIDDPMVEGDAVAYVDATKVTHINYAFGHIVNAQSSSYSSGFTGAVDVPDPDKLRALVALKKQNPDLKVLLSVGGWGMDGFCPIANSATLTENFVKSCVEICERFGLDGIDLDWEYPGTSGDKYDSLTCSHANSDGGAVEGTAYADGEAYLDLLKAFHNNPDFGWDYLLTIASGIGYDWNCSVSIGEMGDQLDFINIMCYDTFGDWTDHSNYNANLYPGSNSLCYDVTCKRLAMRGYPKAIMNIGMPVYGRETILGKGDASWYTYDQIMDLVDQGLTINWDSSAYASYATGTIDGRQYRITFDSTRDIEEKCKWLQDYGFGGAMYWEYSQDTKHGSPITSAIWDGLNGSGRTADPPTCEYRYENNTSYPNWKSYGFLTDNPDGVFYNGKIYEYANKSYAGYHQGTYGWVPAFAPEYATSEYYSAFPVSNTYGNEWTLKEDVSESTRVLRNEKTKAKGGVVDSSALTINNDTPSAKYAAPGATVSWDVSITGGSGSYTVVNQVWFNGLKFNVDGYVKYEKRKTGGPYPTSKSGGAGESKDAISCTNASTSASNYTVSATFPTEGTYYIFTQVTDSNGAVVGQFSQPVTITTETIGLTLNSVTADASSFYYKGGETITWAASASNDGNSAISYVFEVYKDGTKVATSASQAASTYTYNVTAAGVYTCKVTASDASESASLTGGEVNVLEVVPLQITSVTTTDTVKAGSAVTYTAAAKGGTPNYTYSYYLLKDGEVCYSNAYSYLNTCTFTPAAAGTYRLRTYVDDAEGTRVVYEVSVVVK